MSERERDREPLEQEMDRRRKTQHQTTNGQQVVYNTAKTYVGKPERKHKAWCAPDDQQHILLCAEEYTPTREGCKPGALDPPLQRTKMPADFYKIAPVH